MCPSDWRSARTPWFLGSGLVEEGAAFEESRPLFGADLHVSGREEEDLVGYALHAAYWHDDFGRPRSHGCVNLSPIDARYVFLWSSPSVPEHWQAAYAGDSTEPGTAINIHP